MAKGLVRRGLRAIELYQMRPCYEDLILYKKEVDKDLSLLHNIPLRYSLFQSALGAKVDVAPFTFAGMLDDLERGVKRLPSRKSKAIRRKKINNLRRQVPNEIRREARWRSEWEAKKKSPKTITRKRKK